MESSFDTLLIILITLLSVVIITLLVVLTLFLVALRRLVQKAEKLIETSSESVNLLKYRLGKSLGLLSFVRYFARKVKK